MARHQHASTAVTAVALTALVLATAGCTQSSEQPVEGPATIEQKVIDDVETFISTVAAGNFAEALTLTSEERSSLACPDLFQDAETTMPFVLPEVGDVTVTGDTATAEVRYSLGGPQEEVLELTQVLGRWSPALPESYAVTVTFDGPTVAEVVVDDTCRVPVVDSQAHVVMPPGSHDVTIVDPTGVLERSEHVIQRVPEQQTIGTDDLSALEAVPTLGFNLLSGEAGEAFVDALDACLDSDLTDPSCPSALAGADPGSVQAVAAAPVAVLDRLWTDDGETWRFEAQPGALAITVDGTPAEVEVTLTGELARDNTGTLVATLDPEA
ncbi:hypothetical protein Sked_03490 [Sanguibacter keddieii DSM 10542]|uniref:Uncharacterized protein n=1 Tax=Sanguibacter keddieii (strain ATCC 51767 / DSM 10542 / NCFB 3025 / ST-74) TaxID=446469 RepID=D1BJR0_SANKS|nr:hypothetical protein [Sanguibacter keddieii]ACZ20316.1 hypothetical protein Sked_03490 [Sanguibacter keddieii DSM 10542]